MSSDQNTVKIEMPTREPLLFQEYVWKLICVHLGMNVRFVYPKSPAGSYRVSYSNGKEISLSMPFQQRTFSTKQLRIHRIKCKEQSLAILALGERLEAVRGETSVNIGVDLIAPLVSLLQLQDEAETIRRDQFGGVEGRDSFRFDLGVLSDPIFDNTVLWLSELLGICPPPAYPNGASWAIAVSCDIDVLADDHLPQVLDFLGEHEVECPTFMVCAVGQEERTIRDPQYDISQPEAMEFLKPLLAADVEIGLHGSYIAHDKVGLLSAQKQRLEQWCGQPVRGHRAHFYRFAYPRSWAWQFRAGLEYDVSLGYPDILGFRAGFASPITFYDPEQCQVPFTIFPSVVLDQHFFWPEQWDLERFDTCITALMERISRTSSVLTVDYHTYSLSDHQMLVSNSEKGDPPAWWDRLDHILTRAKSAGAYVAGFGKILDCYRLRWDNCSEERCVAWKKVE